ncbi:ABC transporter substrate-binding protein [Streptomyces sp. NPDC002896]|uniref:ABC transporter substrate-binding protein n=1 Tax=Streptomyces sp. NPDC002896 TaxID=3154438 RepID=UPI00333485F2
MAGGTARVIQVVEPQNLDPAVLTNVWALTAVVGNALFGTLMTNDPETGKLKFTMAEDFSSSDGGATFTLKLRPGLKFSDGSPLDAEAVKFNWDRIKAPATGSRSIREAAEIASTKAMDATTLKVTLVRPNPHYPQAVPSSSLNWIASPKALKAGRQAFDAKPVGAGPFTLKKWTRQNSIELVKNPGYWDAPKPYLEALTIRTAPDSGQRLNTMMSGGADVAMESSWATVDKAENAGLLTYSPSLSGGQYLSMNMRKAPFDDVRARKAVAAAIDFDAYNLAVSEGKAESVRTLFTKSSPFYSDTELQKTDKATAQKLFDELAAEGKPVSFTFKAMSTAHNKATAENIQAQLSAFKNVDVKVEIVDPAALLGLYASHDFDMMVEGGFFGDPEPRLWGALAGRSAGNYSGVDDKELNAALDAGRTGKTTAERKAAYQTVQERLAELTPIIFTYRTAATTITSKKVHGVVQYGLGSLLPEELWIQK